MRVDGLRYYNDAEFMCKQPLDLSLPNSKNHTLTILLVVRRPASSWRMDRILQLVVQCCITATPGGAAVGACMGLDGGWHVSCLEWSAVTAAVLLPLQLFNTAVLLLLLSTCRTCAARTTRWR